MRRKRPHTEPDRIKERILLIAEHEVNKALIDKNNDMPLDMIMGNSGVSDRFKVAAYKYHSNKPKPSIWRRNA